MVPDYTTRMSLLEFPSAMYAIGLAEHDKPAFGFYKKQGFKEIEKLVSLMKEL